MIHERMRIVERRFCGKCGRPIAECICGKSAERNPQGFGAARFGQEGGIQERSTTDFGAVRSEQERTNRAGSYYVERFDNLALAQGEVVVRQYHIGKFASVLGISGKGDSSILVTNKRVISKSDTNYFFTSSNMVEELELENVAGVKTYDSQGITRWRIAVALAALFAMFSCFSMARYSGMMVVAGLVMLAVCVWMILTCRKPSYLFSIYSGAMSQAMVMGANLRGKLLNSNGYGIIFQYKPTKEAVRMMSEMGACILDLKQRGDAAIDTWRRA